MTFLCVSDSVTTVAAVILDLQLFAGTAMCCSAGRSALKFNRLSALVYAWLLV